MAARRTRARQHSRRVRRAAPPQAGAVRRRAEDLDRARRGLRPRMTAPRLFRDVRSRLLLIVVLAIAFALAVATVGFNVLFARATSRNADSFLRAKASSELALVSVSHGRIHVAETSDDVLGDSLVWVF